MQALFVNFNVPGKDLDDVAEMVEPLVSAFSDLPGMLAKIWITNPEKNLYGAVYLWRDEESVANFLASELWQSVLATPEFANFDVREYAVIEHFTKETQPALTIV